jgi:hypothetical protein
VGDVAEEGKQLQPGYGDAGRQLNVNVDVRGEVIGQRVPERLLVDGPGCVVQNA